jgi:TetR/AcrR family transcriptional regulator, repressor for uid operon
MANTANNPISFSRLSLDDPCDAPDEIGSRILDAAFQQFCQMGIRRSSMEDVARRAKVGRVTIYRRFESKDKLVAALMWRETRALIAQVQAAGRAEADPEDRFVEGFLVGMRAVRGHPLLVTLVSTEPETLLPLLTVKATSGLELARSIMAQGIRRARADLGIPDVDSEQVAEIFARLTHSLMLTPPSCWPLDDDESTREFARRHIVPMVTGRPARRP